MRQDILLDEEFDLSFVNGDIAVGDAAGQDVELLLLSHKGEWKENPMTGVGIMMYKHSVTGAYKINNVEQFRRDVTVQLMADGKEGVVVINNNDLSDFKIELNAN